MPTNVPRRLNVKSICDNSQVRWCILHIAFLNRGSVDLFESFIISVCEVMPFKVVG
jgi:hypothetical protein